MDYIVNPVYIYLISLLSSIDLATTLIIIPCVIAMIAIGMASFFDCCDGEIWQECKGVFKAVCIIAIVCLIITILIPSKDTMLTMLVAKYVTYTNAGIAIDMIKDVVSSIVESISSII